MNVTIHTSLQDYAFISSGYTPRSGLLDHVVILYLIFSKNHHAAFHNDHTILHFQQQCTRIPVSPHPHHSLHKSKHYSFLIVAILIGTKWILYVLYFFILLLL